MITRFVHLYNERTREPQKVSNASIIFYCVSKSSASDHQEASGSLRKKESQQWKINLTSCKAYVTRNHGKKLASPSHVSSIQSSLSASFTPSMLCLFDFKDDCRETVGWHILEALEAWWLVFARGLGQCSALTVSPLYTGYIEECSRGRERK